MRLRHEASACEDDHRLLQFMSVLTQHDKDSLQAVMQTDITRPAAAGQASSLIPSIEVRGALALAHYPGPLSQTCGSHHLSTASLPGKHIWSPPAWSPGCNRHVTAWRPSPASRWRCPGNLMRIEPMDHDSLFACNPNPEP